MQTNILTFQLCYKCICWRAAGSVSESELSHMLWHAVPLPLSCKAFLFQWLTWVWTTSISSTASCWCRSKVSVVPLFYSAYWSHPLTSSSNCCIINTLCMSLMCNAQMPSSAKHYFEVTDSSKLSQVDVVLAQSVQAKLRTSSKFESRCPGVND